MVKLKELFKGIGTIAIYVVVAILGGLLFGPFYFNANILIASLAQLATYSLLVFILALLYQKRLRNDFKSFKKENIKIALKNWILGLGIMAIFNILISMFIKGMATNESLNRDLLFKYPLSNIISMIFLGPISEEITFRASFKKAFDNKYLFCIVTGLIFGLAHVIVDISLTQILYIIPYGALGFFMAKAFYETDNIYASLIMHVIHNGICVALLLLL